MNDKNKKEVLPINDIEGIANMVINERKTEKIIPINNIEYIVKDINLLKRLSVFDINDSFFEKDFSKENYINAISDYLYYKFSYNNYEENDFNDCILNFFKYVLLPDYKDDISFLLNLKIVGMAYELKDTLKNDELNILFNKLEKKVEKLNRIKTGNELLNYFKFKKNYKLLYSILKSGRNKNKELYDYIINNQNSFSDFFNRIKIDALLTLELDNDLLKKLLINNRYINLKINEVYKNKEYDILFKIFARYKDDYLNLVKSFQFQNYDYSFLQGVFSNLSDKAKIVDFIFDEYFNICNISLHEMADIIRENKISSLMINRIKNGSITFRDKIEKYSKILSIIIVDNNMLSELTKTLDELIDPELYNYDFVTNVLKLINNYNLCKAVFESKIIFNFDISLIFYMINNIRLNSKQKKELMNMPNIKSIAKKDGININVFRDFESVYNDSINLLYEKIINHEYTPKIIDAAGIIFPNKVEELNYDEIISIFKIMYKEENEEYMYSQETSEIILTTLCRLIKEKFNNNYDIKLFYEDSNERGNYGSNTVGLNKRYIYQNMLENYDFIQTIFHENRHATQYNLMKFFPTYETINYIKDSKLGKIYYVDEYGKIDYEYGKAKFNYKRESLEVDARCKSAIETLNFFKLISPSFASSVKKEYIDAIEEEKELFNDDRRKIETNGSEYCLTDIFDMEKTPEKIVEIAKDYPVLYYEYNSLGKRKNILHLMKGKNYWIDKLNKFNYSIEEIKDYKDLQYKLGYIKRSIKLYEDLIFNLSHPSEDKIDLDINYNFSLNSCKLALIKFVSSRDNEYLKFAIDLLIDLNTYLTYNTHINVEEKYSEYKELKNYMVNDNLCDFEDDLFNMILKLQKIYQESIGDDDYAK